MNEIKVVSYPFDEKIHNQNHDLLLQDPLIIKWINEEFINIEQLKRYQSKFLSVIAEQALCRGCLGLSMCKQSKEGHRKTVLVDGVVIDIAIEVCGFMKDRIKADEYLKNYKINHVPKFAQNITLANIDLSNCSDSTLEIIVQLKDVEKKLDKGLFIHGDPGVGKTTLIAALANSLTKVGKKVSFVHVPTWISSAKLSFDDPDQMRRVLNDVALVDVLFMDDIGAESVSAFVRDELLLVALNQRLEQQKITFFTSNLDIEALRDHYSLGKKDATIVKSDRIIERIIGLANPVLLNDVNKRRL
ncbi:MAG: ATP-binding protein [Erysipelothrix sp.]|nr:ATP-binding protein [Erysipelothrix sp.]